MSTRDRIFFLINSLSVSDHRSLTDSYKVIEKNLGYKTSNAHLYELIRKMRPETHAQLKELTKGKPWAKNLAVTKSRVMEDVLSILSQGRANPSAELAGKVTLCRMLREIGEYGEALKVLEKAMVLARSQEDLGAEERLLDLRTSLFLAAFPGKSLDTLHERAAVFHLRNQQHDARVAFEAIKSAAKRGDTSALKTLQQNPILSLEKYDSVIAEVFSLRANATAALHLGGSNDALRFYKKLVSVAEKNPDVIKAQPELISLWPGILYKTSVLNINAGNKKEALNCLSMIEKLRVDTKQEENTNWAYSTLLKVIFIKLGVKHPAVSTDLNLVARSYQVRKAHLSHFYAAMIVTYCSYISLQQKEFSVAVKWSHQAFELAPQEIGPKGCLAASIIFLCSHYKLGNEDSLVKGINLCAKFCAEGGYSNLFLKSFGNYLKTRLTGNPIESTDENSLLKIANSDNIAKMVMADFPLLEIIG